MPVLFPVVSVKVIVSALLEVRVAVKMKAPSLDLSVVVTAVEYVDDSESLMVRDELPSSKADTTITFPAVTPEGKVKAT